MSRQRSDFIGAIALWTMTSIAVLAVLFVLLAFFTAAQGHEAPSGWTYDIWCCSKGDCAPGELFVRDGENWVRTEHGEGKVPEEAFRHLSSKDDSVHACFMHDKKTVRCIYFPAGS